MVEQPAAGSQAQKEVHHQIVQQLLSEFFAPRATRPGFASLVSTVIDRKPSKTGRPSPTAQLSHLCRLLRLNPPQEVLVRLQLLQETSSREESLKAITQKLSESLSSYSDASATSGVGLEESSPEVIHSLLCYLLTGEADHLGVSSELLEALLTALRRDYPPDLVPVVLAPILYDSHGVEATTAKMAQETDASAASNKMAGDNSLADLILETGYAFTAGADECRNHMVSFGLRDLSPAALARALHYMARTHASLDEQTLRNLRAGSSGWPDHEPTPAAADKLDQDGQNQTWNVEHFVQVSRWPTVFIEKKDKQLWKMNLMLVKDTKLS